MSDGPKTNPTGEHRRAESFRAEAIRLAALVERHKRDAVDLAALRLLLGGMLRENASRFYRWGERTDEQKMEDLWLVGQLSQLAASLGIKV